MEHVEWEICEYKGWSKRLEDAFPFYNITDKRLEWMSEFALWILKRERV